MATEKSYFLITSSGQMGTFWLASQLNKHPQIFCSHSYDKPAWGASGAPLRGDDGKRQRLMIKEYFGALSLENFFGENAEVTNKNIIGNVHAYNIDKALQMVRNENLPHVKLINLIRHPISRINSLVKCMKNEWFDFGYFDHLTFIPQLYREHGQALVKECFGAKYLNEFNDSLDKQFFVVAIIMERGTAYQVETALNHHVPNIKYEDITTSIEAMKKLICYMGNETLINDYDWIHQDITYKKINSHTNTTSTNIKMIFKSWEKWKKRLYRHLITEKVFNTYTSNYYDSL